MTTTTTTSSPDRKRRPVQTNSFMMHFIDFDRLSTFLLVHFFLFFHENSAVDVRSTWPPASLPCPTPELPATPASTSAKETIRIEDHYQFFLQDNGIPDVFNSLSNHIEPDETTQNPCKLRKLGETRNTQ